MQTCQPHFTLLVNLTTDFFRDQLEYRKNVTLFVSLLSPWCYNPVCLDVRPNAVKAINSVERTLSDFVSILARAQVLKQNNFYRWPYFKILLFISLPVIDSSLGFPQKQRVRKRIYGRHPWRFTLICFGLLLIGEDQSFWKKNVTVWLLLLHPTGGIWSSQDSRRFSCEPSHWTSTELSRRGTKVTVVEVLSTT